MTIEPLPWHRPAERMPDADLSVLLVLPGEPELEMGWWDGESWRSCVSGGEVVDVLYWSEPQGPAPAA